MRVDSPSDCPRLQTYLTDSVHKVVFQKSILAQIRQLIFYINNDKEQIEGLSSDYATERPWPPAHQSIPRPPWSKPYTLNLEPGTLNPKCRTLHPAPYTLNVEPYTLHHTPYALQPTPHTLHPTPETLHPEP